MNCNKAKKVKWIFKIQTATRVYPSGLFLIHYQWLFKLGPSTFGMEILSNTQNPRPYKISDFLIIEWDNGGVNMRNHGQYLIMINRDHTNVEVV